MLHMSFIQHVTLISFDGRRPSPPSDFNFVTISHASFARFTFRELGQTTEKCNTSYQSLSDTHGKQKADIQKFAMLSSTDLISCNHPDIDKKRFVHRLMRFFILLMSGW